MKKIYSELTRIQQGLKAPKSLYNKFGNYYYRNAEGILEAVKPLLGELSLIINDEPVLIGDRFYIKATVTLTDGEESISATAYAREDETKKGMDGCQITGACSSYARKYALNALLMIDDAKDSDDDSLSPKNPANEPTKKNVTAEVTSSDKIPGTTTSNPVITFLLTAKKGLANKRGIDEAANHTLFRAQHAALVKAKLAPDKPADQYTMEEAAALIDAMQKCFDPMGTEIKVS